MYNLMMRRRPSGQTPEEAFLWYMPEVPPYIFGWSDEDQPCWDWRGPTMKGGYGQIRFNGQPPIYAHRMSYRLFVTEIPPGSNVLHSCDRPPCCQPRHLRPGNQTDNNNDAFERGRAPRGEAHYKTTLTEDDVRLIRTRVLAPRVFAERFGVNPATVRAIQRGTNWRHVT
jgi:hypothetical protein